MPAVSPASPLLAFLGHRLVASGDLAAITGAIAELPAVAAAAEGGGTLLVFHAETGEQVDLDPRAGAAAPGADAATADSRDGAPRDAVASADGEVAPASDEPVSDAQRGRGRPRLGVVPREVTLLPRHWDWLATQPGGASAALRRLVEQARLASTDRDRVRLAQERAYRFMSAMLGNQPDFEEATRALFAGDEGRFHALTGSWPQDPRDVAWRLAAPALSPE